MIPIDFDLFDVLPAATVKSFFILTFPLVHDKVSQQDYEPRQQLCEAVHMDFAFDVQYFQTGCTKYFASLPLEHVHI